MGLDWLPGPKAKPGCDAEFFNLWRSLHSSWCWFRERKKRRFGEITIPAYETLNAPRVGTHPAATEWAMKQFPNRKDKSLSETEFMKGMQGYYVLALVPPCDGLPKYSNGPLGYVEGYSFRGQFLDDCKHLIGGELHEAGYVSKLPQETIAHGERLLAVAVAHGKRVGIDPMTAHPIDDNDEDSDAALIHIIVSAANWCRFWGERGHWLEAYW